MRRNNRRQLAARMTRRERRDAVGTRRSRKPPSWYDDLKDKSPCECPIDAETVSSSTRYSDFGYYRKRCPACDHEWAFFIEG